MADIVAITVEELQRLEAAKAKFAAKGVELGLALGAELLDVLADNFDDIVNRGTIQITVKEGDTESLLPGYYQGGTISGIAGGGNYVLQAKVITPTKKQQQVVPDAGYFGLSEVTVAAIPANFNDTTAVTATAADVVSPKIIVTKEGTTVAGTLPDIGAVNRTLDTETTSYTVDYGKHSGSGVVKVVPQTKSATPTKAQQTIAADSGKVLKTVTIAAIPDKYQDVSPVTAVAAHVLDGAIFVDANGNQVEGSMPNNGAVALTINPLTQGSVDIPDGYVKGGKVTLTDDLYNALAAI